MLSALLASAVLSSLPAPDDAYRKDTATWRQEVEADLRKPHGWLSLVGLSWLNPGDSTIGSAAGNAVVLPASAPAHLGTLHFADGKVTLSYADGTTPAATLLPSSGPQGGKIDVGAVEFVIIQRGTRTGVRIWDADAKALKEFTGCKWFPTDEKYRIEADYTAYPTPKAMPITNVLGDTSPVPNPGYVTFTLNGKLCRLEAQAQGDGFFFNFADRTSGKETYPAGRFLDAPAPKDGKVLLDFNRATNPPCAFTSFATCPLPPASNRLDVAVPAGEKVHHPGH